jgi:beta-galactosidase
MEEVDVPRKPDALLDGLSDVELFMETGEFTRTPPDSDVAFYRSPDAWSYVVDYDDIAPFCELPGPEYWGESPGTTMPPGPDHPLYMVNGITYHWRFGFVIQPTEGQPTKWTMELPRSEEVVGFSFANTTSGYFKKTTGVRLTFENGKPVSLQMKPVAGRQDFRFEGRRTRKVTVELTDWTEAGNVLEVANLWIGVTRSKEFRRRVHPLLNIGVLVKYPMGRGGILLNQLNIPKEEKNPRNAEKKKVIVGHLLSNMLSAMDLDG